MNVKVLRLLILATLVLCTKQASLNTDSSYNAGVVEFQPLAPSTPKERLSNSLRGYMDIIESNDAADLDILVFPEYVLNSREYATFVPDAAQNVTPCFETDYEMFFIELSCSARARGIYVVINVMEKELCGKGYGSDTWNPCPPDGVRVFNTNVVFDRSGRVVSRYRKSHLWRGEYRSTAVLRESDMSIFETDFGVTFGHFICFDMLFYNPAMRLIWERNITDIIYPTHWFSELPFLSALQLQEGWAFANDVNLLAADGSDPAGRTTGSGIYAGRHGILSGGIFEEPIRRLFKARVPKKSGYSGAPYELPPKVIPGFSQQLISPRFTKVATYRDYNVDIFETRLLEKDFLTATEHLCHNDFCCNFDIQRRLIGISPEDVAYRYRLGVYRGNETTFISVDRSEQAVCALFACTSEELLSCGRIFPGTLRVANEYYFERIHISGLFPAAPRRLIMPSTLDGLLKTLDVGLYNWNESPEAKQLTDTQVDINLLTPKNDILTFGIWANYYTLIPSTHNLDHFQPTGTPPVESSDNAAPGIASAASLAVLLAGIALRV